MDKNAEMELERIPTLSNKKISIGTLGAELDEEEKIHEDTAMLRGDREDIGELVSINISKEQQEKHKNLEKLRSSPALIVSRQSGSTPNQDIDNLTDLNRGAE